MALGNGERYYSPAYARFIQQDSWLGNNSMPQSLNRFSYGYNNPFSYTDPSGNIAENNRGSLANSAREYGLNKNGDNNWWNVTKNWAARTGYDLWDTVSFGALSREEENMAAWEGGEITTEQARWNTFKNTAYSGAQVGLMVATGGAGSALTVGANLSTRIAVGAGLGIAEKFGSDLLGMGFGYQKDFSSAGEYATSAVFGGVFGAASPGRAATVYAQESKMTLGTELKMLGQETKELAQNAKQIAKDFGEGFLKPLPKTMNGFVDPISPALYQAGARTFNGVKNSIKQLSRAKNASELRNSKGTVTGGEDLPEVSGQWLRGSEGNAGVIPKQVADKLRGKTFSKFDDFREAFWKAVADVPELNNQFSNSGKTLMKDGKSPFAVKNQRVDGQQQYQLHHRQPIHDYGDVYNLDNIIVVTPRYHQEVLAPGYHYNRSGGER